MGLDLQEVGRRLKEVRLFFDFTQKDLASTLNINQPAISRLEKGGELGSKNLLLILEFYSKFIDIAIIFSEDFNLLEQDKRLFSKDVHLDTIVQEKLKMFKQDMNEKFDDTKAALNKQLDEIYKASSTNKKGTTNNPKNKS